MVLYCPTRKLYLTVQCIIILKISERKDLKYISTKYENSNNSTYVKYLFTLKHCVEGSKYHVVYHRHTIFSCQFERQRLMLSKKKRLTIHLQMPTTVYFC